MAAPSVSLETEFLRRNSVSRRLAPLLILLALLLLGYWLRVHNLDAFSFWTDEGLTPERSGYPIAQILRNEIVIQGVVTKDTHPPLYYLILHATRQLFGLSDFAFRYPSVLFGVLLVPLLYQVGRRMGGATVGLLAALLAAVNPLQVTYSQEARMYTLLVLLVTAMSYVLWRALGAMHFLKGVAPSGHVTQKVQRPSESASHRRRLLRLLAGYSVLAALAIYTHYTVVFLIAAQGVFWAWLLWRAGLRWVILAAAGLGVVAAVPLIPYTLPRLLAGAEANYYPVSPLTMLADVVRFFNLGLTVDFERPPIIFMNLLALALLLLGLWVAGRLEGRPWRTRLFLLAWLLAVVFGLMLGSALFKPMYQGVRHIMAGSPAFLLLLAFGLSAIRNTRYEIRVKGVPSELVSHISYLVFLGLLLLGPAVALINLYTDPAFAKDDFRALIRFIETRAGGNDAVVYNNAVLLPLHEHYRLRPDLAVTALPAYPQFATGQEPELAALAGAYDRLWFVTDPPADGRDDDHLTQGWLDATLLEVSNRLFPARTTEARVIGYATGRSEQLSVVSGQWENFPLLQGIHVDPSPLGLPTLWVDLWWAGDTPPDGAQLLFTLTGPDGAEHYRRAHAPAREGYVWDGAAANRLSYDLPLPPGLPPGTYTLAVAPEGQAPLALHELEILSTDTWPAAAEALFATTEMAAVGGRPAVAWPGLALAAFEPWDDHVLAGGNLPLTLFWRVGPGGIDLTNLRYRLEVIDRRGEVLRAQETQPGAPWLETMAGGAWLREVTSLYFRPETPPGRYRLRWTLLDGETPVGAPVITGEVIVTPAEEAHAKPPRTQSSGMLSFAFLASLREPSSSSRPKRRRRLLWLILLAYLVITLAYGALNPLFEAPDEHWHFFTAESIADSGRLPRVTEPPDEFLGQEAAQPPLYYLLGAALIAPLDTTAARDTLWLNPFAWVGDASALANVNRLVHTAAESWPWRDHVLAAHVLRIFSTLLGLGTLLAVYGSARRLWPAAQTRPLMATALVAFLPQFNFIHASITNDALITFLCSVGLYQLIRLWYVEEERTQRAPRAQREEFNAKTQGRQDAKEDSSWRSLRESLPLQEIILGVTIGLAALSKNAGVLLLLYSLGFLAVRAWRAGRLRDYWRTALRVAVPALLLAVPLWARNAALYGDWTATAPFIAIAGGDRGYTLWQALGEGDGLLLSLVGVFGWFNLRPPVWVYWVWGAIGVLAVVGALSCYVRARRPRRGSGGAGEQGSRGETLFERLSLLITPTFLLALWPLLVYAGLLVFAMRTESAQGRLLFPAILPVALGVAWGLHGWGSCMPRWFGALNRRLSPLVALATLATTVYCLLFVIRPAYQLPALVAALPPDVRPVLPELAARGQGLTLLGARVETETARPGDVVWLTLYWQAETPPAEAPEFVLELFGRDVDRIANLHSYHGRGLYPASLWPAGAIVADRFAVRIEPDAAAPVLARVFARVDGGEPGIEVATVRIVPHEPPPAPDAWQAELGDPAGGTHIALVSAAIVPEQARPGQIIRVEARWYVPVGRPQGDYTTLLHLGQPDSPPLATGDSPPLGGSFPTGAWLNGETIDDVYRLTLPGDLTPGRYPIWIGMYDPATGQRLPVTVEGERQPNDVYLAGWVEVVCPTGEVCD